MPGGPDRGEVGDTTMSVATRRSPRLAAVGVMLLVVGAMALLAYDHRGTDLGVATTALPDGRIAQLRSSGAPGPSSVVLVDRRTEEVRALPPVLAESTSIRAATGPGGLALSPGGWVLLRLAQLGTDTEGGQITEVSPTGDLAASTPVLHWRSSAIIGVTDQGLAVLRSGRSVQFLGSDGQGVQLLDLAHLGVAADLANLAGMALASDGRIAVLVGGGAGSGGYRLFERLAGGAPGHSTVIPRADLVRTSTGAGAGDALVPRPAVAFAGGDVVAVGDAGLVRVRHGRTVAHVRIGPGPGTDALRAPSTLVSLPGDRWLVGRHRLEVLDGSGRLRPPGFGPCPAEPDIRTGCPAVLAGHRLPHPGDILPRPGVGAVAVLLLGLAWAGRMGRPEARRLRLALTAGAAALVTAWLLVGLAWGELEGSAPLLLFAGTALAVLAPAFPAPPAPLAGDVRAPGRSDQPWVSDRVVGRVGGVGRVGRVGSTGEARRLEVVPLPSGS